MTLNRVKFYRIYHLSYLLVTIGGSISQKLGHNKNITYSLLFSNGRLIRYKKTGLYII